MKEYSAEHAKNFSWSVSNHYLITPALNRLIPQAKGGKKMLLDIGCGHGDAYPLAAKKGYRYIGIDASQPMLEIAKAKYPKAEFIKHQAAKVSTLGKKVDVALFLMLFASFKSKKVIAACLKEVRKILNTNGRVVIVIANPPYDGYMQAGILGRKDIQTSEKGYFKSGVVYHVKPPQYKFFFTDYHHTFADIFNAIKDAGFNLIQVDECPPDLALKKKDREYYDTKSLIPSYLALVLEK